MLFFFFFQAEDGIRDGHVTGVQTCALPILSGMKAAGALTRLSLAWSRDSEEKFYVQDRMRQVGGELWSWIADGAHVYVCGAITMGKDVERALVDLIAAHGARTIDEAIAFVGDLKKKGRYQQDVY